MSEDQTSVRDSSERHELQPWVQPTLARLSAGSAELGVASAQPDGDGTFS